MSSLEEYNFEEILKNVAELCDLSEWEHSRCNFEIIGQNYFGVLVPLHLSGTNSDGKVVNLPLVLKLAPTDKRYRISDAITRMFDREMFVYKELLSRYDNIQRSLSTSHYVIPRCYYVCQKYCEEVIAMQDMREEGYEPYSKGNFLDLDHITVSVKSLAKFHALSFILRETNNTLYHEVEQKCPPLNEVTDKRFMEVLNDRLLKALSKFAGTEYIPILLNLKENCAKYIKQATDFAAATCICHGDIWKENILYKYKDSKPGEACIIDYQATRICSPAYDLLYLIISSYNFDQQEYYKHLFDIYYETFNHFLDVAGYNSATIYSRTMLDNDLRVVGPACLIVANTAMWLSNGLQQDGHVRSKVTLSTEEEKSNATQKYVSIMKSIMDDFTALGYLSPPDTRVV